MWEPERSQENSIKVIYLLLTSASRCTATNSSSRLWTFYSLYICIYKNTVGVKLPSGHICWCSLVSGCAENEQLKYSTLHIRVLITIVRRKVCVCLLHLNNLWPLRMALYQTFDPLCFRPHFTNLFWCDHYFRRSWSFSSAENLTVAPSLCRDGAEVNQREFAEGRCLPTR